MGDVDYQQVPPSLLGLDGSGEKWVWKKILKLQSQLLGNITYHIGVGDRVWLWHDPWHPLGPLIHRFPNGPRVTGIPLESKVSLVINEHGWSWPLITDIEHMEIVDHLPRLEDSDGVRWNSTTGEFTISDAYRLFQPPGPTVGWHVLLHDPLRIPRNCFNLWLAILERLSTLDRTWWTGLDSTCVLCSRGETESHSHLFFQCEYASTCLRILEAEVRFRKGAFDKSLPTRTFDYGTSNRLHANGSTAAWLLELAVGDRL
ncbi:UNVERIFIED_CONTAM: hypothetical protein Slati_0880600 [Sesamum latifolium]|uniref:Reverse transcriptase zinc-binding domain-containing protein n=1 Tax=Sesamum latifolium TaxID=2727402 RepID=A0AAW2XQI0_9LAMI